MTPQDVANIAEDASERAIRKVFLQLGVNTEDGEAVLDMQRDFAYLRNWRQSIELVKRRGIGAAVTVVVTGLLGLMYTVFKFKGI